MNKTNIFKTANTKIRIMQEWMDNEKGIIKIMDITKMLIK